MKFYACHIVPLPESYCLADMLDKLLNTARSNNWGKVEKLMLHPSALVKSAEKNEAFRLLSCLHDGDLAFSYFGVEVYCNALIEGTFAAIVCRS